MAKAKARATDDEVCMLIFVKRGHAWEAMSKIAEGLSGSTQREPTFTLLVDYLSNMVQTLELMLKLLSGNWDNHQVDKMAELVFGKPHPNPDFMACLKQAIVDQKYLFTPSADPNDRAEKTIAHYIPELEKLFRVLRPKLIERHPTHAFFKQAELPVSFGEYLRDELWRFLKRDSPADGYATVEEAERAEQRHQNRLLNAAVTLDRYLKRRKAVGVGEGRARATVLLQ